MDTDLVLVVGIVMTVLSIPAIFSSLVDGRAPRIAAIVALAGGGLIAYAMTNQPGGYQISEIPDAFFRVIGRWF